MKRLKPLSALTLIVLGLLLSAAKSAALPPNAKEAHRSPGSQKHNTEPQRQTTPQACPSVTVIVKDAPAQDAKQITAVIQQQPYEHWWEGPNGPEWALFLLTIVYVVVTGGLFCVTWKAANAAKESADAAFAAATAYVHVMRISLEGQNAGHDIMEGWIGVADPIFHYGFTNYGKSPAFLLEMCWEHCIAARLPDKPIYQNRGPIFEMFVIPAEQNVDAGHKWSILFGNYLAENDFEPVRKMQTRFFVYGYMRYRDVFERRYMVGFAYHLDAKGRAYVVTPDIAPNFVYRSIDKT